MSWLFGTGTGFFDYWAIAHITFWFFMGSTIAAVKINRYVAFAGSLVGAVGWEIFERYAEGQWPMIWQSPESFLNAWVSDIVMCIAGLLVAWWGYDRWR